VRGAGEFKHSRYAVELQGTPQLLSTQMAPGCSERCSIVVIRSLKRARSSLGGSESIPLRLSSRERHGKRPQDLMAPGLQGNRASFKSTLDARLIEERLNSPLAPTCSRAITQVWAVLLAIGAAGQGDGRPRRCATRFHAALKTPPENATKPSTPNIGAFRTPDAWSNQARPRCGPRPASPGLRGEAVSRTTRSWGGLLATIH